MSVDDSDFGCSPAELGALMSAREAHALLVQAANLRAARRLNIATAIMAGWARHGTPVRSQRAWEEAVAIVSLADAALNRELAELGPAPNLPERRIGVDLNVGKEHVQ